MLEPTFDPKLINANVSSKLGISKKSSWMTSRILIAFPTENTGKLVRTCSIVKIASQFFTTSTISWVEKPWLTDSSIANL